MNNPTQPSIFPSISYGTTARLPFEELQYAEILRSEREVYL